MSKKKIIALLLTAIMVLSLAACGSSGSASGNAPAPSAPAASSATAEESKPAEAAPAAESSEASAPAEEAAEPEVDPNDPKAIAEAAGYDYTKVDTSDWVTLDLSYAAYLPAGNPISDLMFTSLRDSCEKLMPGYVEMTLFASGTLVSQDDMLEGITNGVADCGMVDVGPVTAMLPVTALWGTGCYPTGSTTAITAAMQEWLQKNYDLPEFQDIVVLGMQGSACNQLATTKPWETLDDIKGLQCCVQGTYSEMLKAMGTVPVSMQTSELYEASRSGLIDGVFYTIGMVYLSGAQEYLKYSTTTGYGASPHLIAMNKDVFNSMPPLQQEFMMEAGREAIWEIVVPTMPTMGDMFEPSLWCIQDTDYTYFELPQETLDQIGELVAPLRQQYVDANIGANPEIADQAVQMEELSNKWNEWYPIERYLDPVKAAMNGTFGEWLENVEENTRLPEYPDIDGYVPVADR